MSGYQGGQGICASNVCGKQGILVSETYCAGVRRAVRAQIPRPMQLLIV